MAATQLERFRSGSPRSALGENPELYTQIGKKTAPAWKRADIEYFSPDRLEAYPTLRLASSRWVREGAFRCTRVITRHSGSNVG